MFDIGGPQFGLADVKLALRNSGGSYGTALTVPSVQVLRSSIETVNARLEGNDRRTATAAKAIGGSLTLKFGSISTDVLQMLCGGNIASSGTTPSRVRSFKVTNRKYPAIGLVGKSNAEEGAGDTHLFIPYAKVHEGFEVGFEYGTFSIPEVTLDITPDSFYADGDGYTPLFVVIAHETATSVVIPPVLAGVG